MTVVTKSGSIYDIKNGRITRVIHGSFLLNEEVIGEPFEFRSPLEMGQPMFIHLKNIDRVMMTTSVVAIMGAE